MPKGKKQNKNKKGQKSNQQNNWRQVLEKTRVFQNQQPPNLPSKDQLLGSGFPIPKHTDQRNLNLGSNHEEEKREMNKFRKEIEHLENETYKNDRSKMQDKLKRNRNIHNEYQHEQKVHRPNFRNGNLEQKTSVSQVASGWDEMLIQKQYPGQMEGPYIAGMNAVNLPTNKFTIAGSFDKCNLYTQTGETPIGTADYTIIMWSSSATAFFGKGGPGYIPASDKLGGMVIKQFNADDIDAPFFTREIFTDAQSARTMTEVYESDMSGFSSGGFVYASEININTLIPLATLVGAQYKGTIPYGSLPVNGNQQQLAPLSLRNLIDIANKVDVMKPQFCLRTAVVNHDIVFKSQERKGEGLLDANFNTELISYCVLQTPAKSLADQSNIPYSIQYTVSANSVFWPLVHDTIANYLFKTTDLDTANSVNGSTNPLPNLLKGVQQNPEAPPGKIKTFAQGARKMLGKLWENKEDLTHLLNVGRTLVPMFMDKKSKEPNEDDDKDETYVTIKANYSHSLEQALIALQTINVQNPYLDLQSAKSILQAEVKRIQNLGRIIPVGPDDFQQEAYSVCEQDVVQKQRIVYKKEVNLGVQDSRDNSKNQKSR